MASASGLTEGFNTCMIILPEEKKAIFVGINSGVGQAFEIAAGIFHILIDKDPNGDIAKHNCSPNGVGITEQTTERVHFQNDQISIDALSFLDSFVCYSGR